jgi:hypothetical protein
MAIIAMIRTLSLALIVSAGATVALAQDASPSDNPATYRGTDREQRLVDGARKEAQVTVYSSMIVDQALRPLIDVFRT